MGQGGEQGVVVGGGGGAGDGRGGVGPRGPPSCRG